MEGIIHTNDATNAGDNYTAQIATTEQESLSKDVILPAVGTLDEKGNITESAYVTNDNISFISNEEVLNNEVPMSTVDVTANENNIIESEPLPQSEVITDSSSYQENLVIDTQIIPENVENVDSDFVQEDQVTIKGQPQTESINEEHVTFADNIENTAEEGVRETSEFVAEVQDENQIDSNNLSVVEDVSIENENHDHELIITESETEVQNNVKEDVTEIAHTDKNGEETLVKNDSDNCGEVPLESVDFNTQHTVDIQESETVGDTSEVHDVSTSDVNVEPNQTPIVNPRTPEKDIKKDVKQEEFTPQTQKEEDPQNINDEIDDESVNRSDHNIVAQLNEVTGNIQYTVMGHDPQGVEIIHSPSVSSGNVVLIQQISMNEGAPTIVDMDQIEAMDTLPEHIYLQDIQQTVNQDGKPKKPKGRKPTNEIPLHVLGRNIANPTEPISNGKSLPKPRLGVKVPYRNLTSQIVSKEEIQKEIMERVRIKQEQSKPSGDVIFAKKLTQRLARKLAPSPDPPRREVQPKIQPAPVPVQVPPPQAPPPTVAPEDSKSSRIENNSDLLAILEGDGDDLPIITQEEPVGLDEVNIKSLEREIALQQLQELPNLTPKSRIFRGRHPVEESAEKMKAIVKAAAKLTEKDVAKTSTVTRTATKSSTEKQPQSSEQQAQPFTVKQEPQLKKEVEPQVKVNMVLKTYSRKRKSTDFAETSQDFPMAIKQKVEDKDAFSKTRSSSEINVPTSSVYVTKSSRVIKKKVIWDPDETPSRTPVKGIPKPQESPASPKPAKIVPKTPIQTPKTAEKKVITTVVEKEKKKPAEKPVAEKKVLPKKDDKLSPNKSKKRLTEIDRLLMDEGAVNMLYDVKNTEDANEPRKKKSTFSVDRAHKELMKKTNEIKNDLLDQNNVKESPKSLRKKEIISPPAPAALLRKQSKDSTRSSIHTPPASPAQVYQQNADASRIIRRRSSSSISSNDDVEDEIDTERTTSRKKSSSAIVDESPKPKKLKNNNDIILNDTSTGKKEKSKKSEMLAQKVLNKLNNYKSFTVKKSKSLYSIDLNYINEESYFTIQVLEELTDALKAFNKDKECNVVCVTSNSSAFCLGLDYKSLVVDTEDAKKKKATELATAVRNFLKCLLNFPKVLVAGIQGDCVGLGVTMLPLFDLVIASDTATFSTSYSNLGSVVEGGFLLGTPFLSSNGLAAELLYTSNKLKAEEVLRRGLVTKLCWPEKYHDELKSILQAVGDGSRQSMEATKKQLRSHMLQNMEAAINSNIKVLIDHWTSTECQNNFANLRQNV